MFGQSYGQAFQGTTDTYYLSGEVSEASSHDSEDERQEAEAALYNYLNFTADGDHQGIEVTELGSSELAEQCEAVVSEQESEEVADKCTEVLSGGGNENKFEDLLNSAAETRKCKKETHLDTKQGLPKREQGSPEKRHKSKQNNSGDKGGFHKCRHSDESNCSYDGGSTGKSDKDIFKQASPKLADNKINVFYSQPNRPVLGNVFDKKNSDESLFLIRRVKRYFRKPITKRCHKCKEVGHLARNCTKIKVCFLCSAADHFIKNCPDIVCQKCEELGHVTSECKHPRFSFCYRCQNHGHFKEKCPEIWRQYHITTKKGELVRGKSRCNERMFCYNCGASNHFGYECKKRKMNAFIFPNCPFISKYDRMITLKRKLEKYGVGRASNTKKMRMEENDVYAAGNLLNNSDSNDAEAMVCTRQDPRLPSLCNDQARKVKRSDIKESPEKTNKNCRIATAVKIGAKRSVNVDLDHNNAAIVKDTVNRQKNVNLFHKKNLDLNGTGFEVGIKRSVNVDAGGSEFVKRKIKKLDHKGTATVKDGAMRQENVNSLNHKCARLGGDGAKRQKNINLLNHKGTATLRDESKKQGDARVKSLKRLKKRMSKKCKTLIIYRTRFDYNSYYPEKFTGRHHVFHNGQCHVKTRPG